MLRAVENLRCSNNIEQTGWHLLNLALAVHTYSLEPRIKLLRGRSTFLYEEVCRLLEVFFVGIRWRKKWEISLTFAHTSFTLYVLSCRYFHLQRVFFCFRSCTFQRFVDIEVFLKLYLFFFRRLVLRWPFASVPASSSFEAVCPHSFLAIWSFGNQESSPGALSQSI